MDCCTDNTIHPIMSFNPAMRTLADAQVVAGHGEGLSFVWNPMKQNRPWIGESSLLRMDQVHPTFRASVFAASSPTCSPEQEFSVRQFF